MPVAARPSPRRQRLGRVARPAAQAARGAVLLRFAGDLSHREVAAAMDISEEAPRRRNAFEGLTRFDRRSTA